MVVMEDGLPKRSDYRRFKMQPPGGPGRLRRDGRGAHPPLPALPRASATKARARGKRFAYPPNLLLVDGGKGQLGVAVRVLEELGLEDICGASAWPSGSRRSTCPGSPEPVRIPRDSEALYLLQQVRDEAHRFAITYHRKLRDKKMTQLGARRRARARARPGATRLLKEFGSVKRLRELTEDELRGAALAARDASADAVYAQLHGDRPSTIESAAMMSRR